MKIFPNANPMMLQQMMFSQLQNNPLFQRAQQMAAGKSPQEIEQIARNLCRQRGVNMDRAFYTFRQQMGLKK